MPVEVGVRNRNEQQTIHWLVSTELADRSRLIGRYSFQWSWLVIAPPEVLLWSIPSVYMSGCSLLCLCCWVWCMVRACICNLKQDCAFCLIIDQRRCVAIGVVFAIIYWWNNIFKSSPCAPPSSHAHTHTHSHSQHNAPLYMSWENSRVLLSVES